VKILALVLLLASSARADGLPCDKTCSVNRNCSSTGVACAPDDRECTGAAAAKGLEVKCEQSCDTGKVFVYCPPDTGRSDSGFVWILLVIAGVLAVGGGAISFVVLRKKT
jgi:hypothetical protein